MKDSYKFVWNYDFGDDNTARLAEMSILSQAVIWLNLHASSELSNIDIVVDQIGSKVIITSDDEQIKRMIDEVFIPVFMEIMRENDEG